jgi:hypothetical protein
MIDNIINYPPFVEALDNNTFGLVFSQDTAGEQAYVWGTPISESWTSGTKQISGVEVVYGSVTANSASIWNVSLQAQSASGNPIKPTGIPLAVWSGSVTSSTFAIERVITHSFTSSYEIPTGSRLGVLFKYDTFVSPTTLNVRGFNAKFELDSSCGISTTTNSGSTWSINTATTIASLRLLCTDGSKLFFDNYPDSLALSSVTSNDYSSTATGTGIDSGDERGMLWVPKKTYDISRFQITSRLTQTSSIANFRMYRDTTLLANKTIFPIDNIDIGTSTGYSVDISPPIRVYPNENIRFTQMPVSGNIRHIRFTFVTPTDLQNFFGGDDDETNFSFTNRVDGGAWNTPSGATSSSLPLQIYGMEVTGSELIKGTLKISGSVSVAGQPVSGAQIFALRQSDGLVITTSSATDGRYELYVTSSSYHVFAQYQSGGQKYNVLSSWNVQPVL